MGQNLAASAALSNIITPMISAFCWRTSLRRSSMYDCTFFFWMSASEGAAPVLLVSWAFVCAWQEGGEDKIRTKRVAGNIRIASFISIILSLNFSTKNLRGPNAVPFWPLQPGRYPGRHSAASRTGSSGPNSISSFEFGFISLSYRVPNRLSATNDQRDHPHLRGRFRHWPPRLSPNLSQTHLPISLLPPPNT